jgi:hypothetical protein
MGRLGRGPGTWASGEAAKDAGMDILGIGNLESGIMSMSMLGEDRNRIEPLARVRLDASEARPAHV